MHTYILRRLALAVPTVFGVTVLIFIAMRILPGDPLEHIYGENTGIYVLSEAELQAARKSLGLDRPLVVQYGSWIADIARGDMGTSFWTDQPISASILRRGPLTMQIAIIAVLVSWIVGLPVGIVAGGLAQLHARLRRQVCYHALHGGPKLLAGHDLHTHYRYILQLEASHSGV